MLNKRYSVNNKSAALNDSIEAIYTKFQLPYNGLNNDDIIPGFQPALMSLASTASSTDNYEEYSYYIHSDHLGSTSYITDSDGEVSQHVEYVPFGEVFIEELSSSAKLNTPYLFNGKEFDEETGLYYYGARYYDPRTSLWLSTDPMELKYSNISTYTYCANNPVKLIDPQGTEAVYNLNGDYLGSTKEGFTGDILIHIGDEPIFDISNYSRTELQQNYSADIETLDDVRTWTVGGISNENQSKIWTHIASQFEGLSVYDEIFSMNSIRDAQISYEERDAASWTTFYNEDPTYKPKIIGTGGYSYESTVENIASSVIVHEWYSHGKKYNSDKYKSHRLAYKNVINFKRLWNKTTDEYKKFNLQQLLKYTKKETGRNNVDPLYRRLYNKYVK